MKHGAILRGMMESENEKERAVLGMCLEETNKKVIEVVTLMARGFPNLFHWLWVVPQTRHSICEAVTTLHGSPWFRQDHSHPTHLPWKLN
jgi:hypothetical protein